MIEKQYLETGRECRVTFRINPEQGASSAALVGDFNGWNPGIHPFERTPEGGLKVSVELPAGTQYRFRYLVEGSRWLNDEAPDALVPNPYGGLDALVALPATDLPEAVKPKPSPGKRRPKAASVETSAEPAAGSASRKGRAGKSGSRRRASRPTSD